MASAKAREVTGLPPGQCRTENIEPPSGTALFIHPFYCLGQRGECEEENDHVDLCPQRQNIHRSLLKTLSSFSFPDLSVSVCAFFYLLIRVRKNI